jgi:hypothetical protein
VNGRYREELVFRLFRVFFRSRSRFLTLFDRYEERVLAFAARYRSHRSRLRLPVDELLTVLDFKSLEELRDREILELKEIAHDFFRDADSTDLFDHLATNIYHEISMLKEEHYTLREGFLRTDPREYERFFREVSEFYPKRLRHVRNLYARALRRLEELLPQFGSERILVRSLYLFGESLLAEYYPRGRTGLYRKMYPELGEVQAFAEAGRSFDESGFEEEALQAYRLSMSAAGSRRVRKREEAVGRLREDIGPRIAALETSLAAERTP